MHFSKKTLYLLIGLCVLLAAGVYFYTRDLECGSFGCLHAIPAPDEVILAPADDAPKGGVIYDRYAEAPLRTIATTTELTRITAKNFSFNLRPGWHAEERRKDEENYYALDLQYGNEVPIIVIECPIESGKGWEEVRSLGSQVRKFINGGVSYVIDFGKYTADQNEPWYTTFVRTTQPDGSTDTVCKVSSGTASESEAQMREMYSSWQ
jgi:hypothetical protein